MKVAKTTNNNIYNHCIPIPFVIASFIPTEGSAINAELFPVVNVGVPVGVVVTFTTTGVESLS